ncbi:chaperone protein (heat shock protein) [Halobacteriovorax marinus SJ]|uniref:Chaperone protein (Heat shock protein) n=1 Tax=Halobacteriovorax marinus (strain ATCC BAA-682 / DSM 15412 / SJ) TaxID=862908 RepID=E1WZ54_HALMS|nr:molecular chaperone HtpG [Halobacteriovorax marinus]CBW26151.1 chaperone protein (heat shock protein) [Halobacteriovorax marinus SJ]
MTERKGNISVNTSDIFPIIKKWLYSEHDIFIRELVANATDAITKRHTLSRNLNVEIPQGSINISVNKDNKLITISDNGLGMSEADIEKYIAQLAFSGAEEFVKKLKDEGAEDGQDIIGKFGLGFYSAFMVADKVEIESLSMNEGAKATKWICEGDTEYTFTDSTKETIGTTIYLHINEESAEFLNEWKLSETLRNHCDYMPYEIGVLDEMKPPQKPLKEDGTVDEEAPAVAVTPTIINETRPIWKRDPKELKDEDYKEFYRKQFPMDGDPLFWIHLKVDHPFTLEGVLFFPKFNPMKPQNEHNIRLYCKQVFVSDNVKNVIPDFLSLLKGSIDSVDIPLNVSRSSLQGDPNVQKISNYVVKKVAEALKVLFKKDREKFETIWEDIHLFIKYGCVSDPKFDELMRERVVYKASNGKYLTLGEYLEATPEKYKEKMKGKVLYFEKEKSDAALKNQLLAEGLLAIECDDHIDPHFFQHTETKKIGEETLQFVSVDSEIGNLLESENTTEEDMKIKDLFSNILAPKKEGEENSLDGNDVEISKITGSTTPAYFKVDEQMKRFAKMAQSMGQQNTMFPTKKTLVINPSSPLIQNALKIHEKGGNEALVEKICHHVEDLALISSEGLKADEKELFIARTQDLMQELTTLAL